jgi:hypothetical protein
VLPAGVHPGFLLVLLVLLMTIGIPLIAIVAIVVAGRQKAPASFPSQPVFSPDGNWWWDGQRWQPALSADGQWRWSGATWEPTGAAGARPGAP